MPLSRQKDTLDLPGGFVDPGESIDRGMRREILEETGCRVAEMKWLFSLPNSYMFSGFSVPTADSFFLCRLETGETPAASDDAAALRWIAIEKLDPEDFGLDLHKKSCGKVQNRKCTTCMGQALKQMRNAIFPDRCG